MKTCKAVVRKEGAGSMIISLDRLLQEEPLALYVDGAGQLSLRLCDGQTLSLEHEPGGYGLAQQNEVTIESVIGGFLAAGYRVGVRAAA